MINGISQLTNILKSGNLQKLDSSDTSTSSIFGNNSTNQVGDTFTSASSSSEEETDTTQTLQEFLVAMIGLLTNLLSQSIASSGASNSGTSAQSGTSGVGSTGSGNNVGSTEGTSGTNSTSGVSNTNNNTTTGNSNVDKDAFAKEFDEACANHKGSVLNGKGSEIYDIATENGIDPALFAAIICNETGYGTSNAIQNKNNPGGIMKSSGGLKSYGSLDEGLNSMAKLLKNNYIDQGLTSISSISHKYCPGSDNSSWQNVVGQLYEKFSS